MAVTPTASDANNGDASFSIGNFSAGSVNIIVDVVGFYTPLAGGGGSVFKAITPTRVVDTRIHKGLPHPLGPAASGAVATSSVFGDAATVAMVANATGLGDPSGTYLSVYPGGSAGVPATSSLNLAAREVRSNMVMPRLSASSTRSFAEYNRSGTLDTLVDVVGYFEGPRNLPSVTTPTSSAAVSSYDTPLTLTASVAGAFGAPTGYVTFADGGNGSVLAIEPVSGGVARLTTAALAQGTRTIVVAYSGDHDYAPSVPTSLVITVAPPHKSVATAFQNDSRHDGMDAGDTFNPATLHQAWSVNLNPIGGTASVSYPLIAGGRVFAAVANSKGGDNLYALDATTGSLDWSTPLSSTFGWLGLTYDGGQVFVQNSDGTIWAFDAASGHTNWTAFPPPAQDMFSAPPTAYDGVLYSCGTGNAAVLLAISEANGQVLWSAGLSNGDISSPAVDDSGVYADYACQPATGYNLDGSNRFNDVLPCTGAGGATPVLNGAYLYLPGAKTGYGGAIVSTATGVSSGTFGGTMLPAFDATNMYIVAGGVLAAVDKSGSPSHWSFTGDGAIDTTPVTTNGIVFTGSSSGNLYGIDSSTGAQVWTTVAPGPVTTTDDYLMHTGLAAANGLLVVPAGGFLTAYTN
jgi:outer membrane protein assembly factor BamB